MKKLISLFAAMCCMMVANATEFTDANGIKYNVTSEDDKTVEVIANNYSGDIVIPATVTNSEVTYSVTGIGDNAFYCRYDQLTSVTLPNSITRIGDYAFASCWNLKSFTLPNSVKTIGNKAFEYSGIETFTTPNSLESIGDNAFCHCNSLTSVTILNNVESIGNSVFAYCENLAAVSLSDGLKTIGNSAFFGCIRLTSITIPNSVESIGDEAFRGCIRLASVNLPDGLKTIGNRVFDECERLTSITIPNSVESIGEYAFGSCQKLTSVTIPSSVKSIGYDAFYGCSEMTSVTLSSGLETIGSYAFEDCKSLTSITIPSSVTKIGYAAFSECKNLTSVTLSINIITSIESYAFDGCVALTSMTILTSNPPTLDGESIFGEVPITIPVYVPDVTKYQSASWGGFTNFIAIDIDDYKQAAINEINAARTGLSLSSEETTAVNGYITAIENVETMSDENLAIIENAKNSALATISQAIIRIAREAALADIEAAMQGETSDYLTGLAQEYIDAINAATDETTISNIKTTAVTVINAVMPAYKAGKSAGLGEMGDECTNCPAIKVTKGDTEIILYAPNQVEFLKTEAAE